MRDAFGGTFMIQLLIVFIVIYVSFTALALNYAKAFKAKNAIIEYLEKNEISDVNMTAQAEQEMLDYFNNDIVGGLQYIHPISCREDNNTKCYSDIGIKIQKITPNGTSSHNKLGVYYRVTTYFGYDISFLNVLRRLNGTDDGQKITGAWEIIGETRPIAYE